MPQQREIRYDADMSYIPEADAWIYASQLASLYTGWTVPSVGAGKDFLELHAVLKNTNFTSLLLLGDSDKQLCVTVN
jgi:hypothetical protein